MFIHRRTLLSLSKQLIICARITFGFQSSLQSHLPYLTAVALTHPSTLNTPNSNYIPFLFQARMHWPIDLSLLSLDGWCWSVCHIIQKQYLRLFFPAGPIASSFTAETHPQEHRLIWCNNHTKTWPRSVSPSRTPNQLFSYFQRPHISLAKTPIKCLISCLFTFQQCLFKLSISPRSIWYLWK